jgi:spermidine synthase
VQDDVASSGFKVGVLQSANIAGCVLGAIAVGLRWFDQPGTAQTFRLLIASGCLFALLALASAIRSKTNVRTALGGLAALALVALALPGQSAFWLRLHGRSDSGTLVSEDVTGIAALVSEGDQRWRMSVNGKGQSHIPFGGVHSKLGALPATLLPAPEQVAIIGLGTGDTAWAAGCRSETKLLRVFELSARQLPLLEQLVGQHKPARLDAFLRNPALEVVTADGRTELAQSDTQYDLIEADAIRPNGAYSGNLYSIEFFRLCASRLRPGGLMCSWSPTERTRRTFLEAFPYVVEVDNGVVLLGSNTPISIDLDRWAARIRSEKVSNYLGSEVVAECLSALASARPLTLKSTVAGDRNTDLFPRDEYLTPAR